MSFWDLGKKKSFIKVTNLNDQYIRSINDVSVALGGKSRDISRRKNGKRIFVIDFDGDPMASQATGLSFEVTSIICNAKSDDEVFVRLTSPGGAAYAYGYAASQLKRLKDAGIPLTVSVDKVAASGGYLMACVADRIISAPWAIIGSIGVVSEMPNLFNLLQKMGVDYKQYTAGKHKRTVSILGPITEEGEEKFKSDLNDVYELFRSHVSENRPSLGPIIDQVATGEHWQGIKAKEISLVDQIQTSEEYILSELKSAEFLQVKYVGDKKTLAEKLGEGVSYTFARGLFAALWESLLKISTTSKLLG